MIVRKRGEQENPANIASVNVLRPFLAAAKNSTPRPYSSATPITAQPAAPARRITSYYNSEVDEGSTGSYITYDGHKVSRHMLDI